jgi:hypothetical protein
MSEFTVIYEVLMLLMMFTITAIKVYSLREIIRKEHHELPQIHQQIPRSTFPISQMPATPFNVPSMSN